MHGTRIEIEFKSSLAARKRLIEYLRYTSVVNPHARLRIEIEGEAILFDRASDEPVIPPKAILPHPHGVELGELKRIAGVCKEPLETFLINSFSRVGQKTAGEIVRIVRLKPGTRADKLDAEGLSSLQSAMQQAKVPPPQANLCLSPIGEALIRQGLEKEFQFDFCSARTRPAGVHHGHPFIVEAALWLRRQAGNRGNARIMRFANRVPPYTSREPAPSPGVSAP